MFQEDMGAAEGLLIAFFLFMSVVLGLVILWVARNLKKDPADPQNRVAKATQNGTDSQGADR